MEYYTIPCAPCETGQKCRPTIQFPFLSEALETFGSVAEDCGRIPRHDQRDEEDSAVFRIQAESWTSSSIHVEVLT